jgi:hypothetical protein
MCVVYFLFGITHKKQKIVQSAENPDYQLSEQDILDWEAVHGTIREGTIVLVHTDRAKLYANRYTIGW